MNISTRTGKAAARIKRLAHTAVDEATKLESGRPVRVHGIYITGANLTNDVTVNIQDNDGNNIIIFHPHIGQIASHRPLVILELDIPFVASNGIQSVVTTASATALFTTVLYDNVGV